MVAATTAATPTPGPTPVLAPARSPREDADVNTALMGRVVAAADDARLSAAGQPMADLVIDPEDADISVTVDVDGETPLASYVMAHTPAGLALQRTAPGRWEPWDGQAGSLVDNGFRSANGRLTFEIMEGDLSEEFFPVTFTVAYQTKEALKYGVFQAMPDQHVER